VEVAPTSRVWDDWCKPYCYGQSSHRRRVSWKVTQRLRIGHTRENPLLNIPCNSAVAVQVDIPEMDFKVRSGKTSNSDKGMELILTHDGKSDELRNTIMDPIIRQTRRNFEYGCNEYTQTCKSTHETYGPFKVSNPKKKSDIYIDMVPSHAPFYPSPAHRRGKTTARISVELPAQKVGVTFWWKTPLPTMDCSAPAGELQYAKEL